MSDSFGATDVSPEPFRSLIRLFERCQPVGADPDVGSYRFGERCIEVGVVIGPAFETIN